jgi:hypothetical protein
MRFIGSNPTKPFPVAEGDLVKYEGFDVTVNDFRLIMRKGPTIWYRVNPDGSLVNLQRWHFDTKTGEFFLVKSRNSGSVIFSTKTYEQRLVGFREHTAKRFLYAGIIAVCAFFFFTAAQDFGLLRYHPNYSFTASLVNAALVVVPFGLLLFSLVYSVIQPKALENWVVGPRPLTRRLANGPRTPEETKIKDISGLAHNPTV